jgi:DNA repair protein RAD50
MYIIRSLNKSNDLLVSYVRDKRDRRLKECAAKVEELDTVIKDYSRKLDEARKVLAGIEKEINESAASMANLRDNIRARKLVREIASVQAEIDTYDLEEAAKAKRLFEEKYQIEKDKETELQSKVRSYNYN